MTHNNDCNKYFELIDAYYDLELNDEEKIGVEDHLSQCLNCKEHLHSLETLVPSLRSLTKIELSSSAIESMNLELFNKKNSENVICPKSNIISLNSLLKAKQRSIWKIGGFAAACAIGLYLAFDIKNGKNEFTESELTISSAKFSQAKNLKQKDLTNLSLNENKFISKPLVPRQKLLAENKQDNIHKNYKLATKENSNSEDNLEIALLNGTADMTDGLGISTNEDGLYDIKI